MQKACTVPGKKERPATNSKVPVQCRRRNVLLLKYAAVYFSMCYKNSNLKLFVRFAHPKI